MHNLDKSTVKELSNDLNVSRQTIYNKIEEIRRETPKNEHSNYFEQIGNTLNVKRAGIKLIYEKLGVKINDAPTDPDNNIPLMEIIKTLQEQLKVKDEQILKLTETIQQQQESITTQLKTNREQGYIKALETQIKSLEEQPKPNYKQENVFKRIWEAIKGNNEV